MSLHPNPRFLHIFALLFCWFSAITSLSAQDYQKAWDALAKSDLKSARTYLEKAQKQPATAADAALTSLLVEVYDGQDANGQAYFEKALKSLKDPYPYYFALWENEAVGGNYGLKSPEQLKLNEKLIEDPNAPEVLKGSARYMLSHHYIGKDEHKKAQTVTAPIGNVLEWQFTGPFDNVSESGFDKNYPPVEQAAPDSRFKATNNADIQWFTPGFANRDGWVIVGNHIKWNTGIAYAQSFVTAPADMDVLLATGYTGSSIKVWVNGRLVLAEQEIRKTDFDLFTVPCKLQKGNNRILVQIGLMNTETANFSVRVLDKNGKLATGLVSSAKYAPSPKVDGPLPARLPFFAEEYFSKKIAEEPDNLLNYYLLCETYQRSFKGREALEVVEKAVAKMPESIIFRFQRLQCLQKIGNRTELTKEVENLKTMAPDQLIAIIFKYGEAFENEKYDEAQALLDRWGKLYGEDEKVYEKRIKLALNREKYQEAVELIAKAYAMFPEEPYFANMQHDVEISINKDPRAAIRVYERFLGKNFYLPLAFALADDYIEQGAGSKALDMYEKLDKLFPGDASTAERFLNYYYSIKDTGKAKMWSAKLLSIAPFHGAYWETAAKLAERAQDSKEALTCFQKALHYNPNDYDVRRQIRELQGKPDFSTLMPQYDIFELYKNSKTEDKEGEYDWYYILDERCDVLHPERNSESYNTLCVKILNEAGIDYWKESSIGYDNSRQRLIIEKAEILKPNGSRITAEQNGNEMVFPNLEIGDGVYFRYRLVNYAYGRMAREFWTSYYFNAFVPTDKARYCLFTPPSIPLQFKNINNDIQPTEKKLEAENLKQYTWELTNEPAMKDQRLMPRTCDIGKVLHVSSLSDWNEISGWYGDVSAAQAKRDYDVLQLAKELFPAGNKMSETEKARAIYTWILKNIRYSSVPFRQSGYVPQLASKVIQTKLGDCKDLATLYAALAREVGMKANLVLIDTRDQGEQAMVLPSMEFNHCIVKVVADGKPWYLELTNPELPFGSLGNSDYKAIALEIPFEEKVADNKPFKLDPANRLKDYRREKTQIEIKGRELVINTNGIRGGAVTADMRNTYKTLSPTKRVEEMQNRLAKSFNNTLSVKSLNFGDLNALQDTVHFSVRYSVKNEVAEIGQLNTFKVPFYATSFNADAFPDEERHMPLNYWEYEDADHYLEEITVQLPEGKSFSDVPKDVSLAFGKLKYDLKYKQSAPGTLLVTREIVTERHTIPASEYAKFREFTEQAIQAETRWIAFK